MQIEVWGCSPETADQSLVPKTRFEQPGPSSGIQEDFTEDSDEDRSLTVGLFTEEKPVFSADNPNPRRSISLRTKAAGLAIAIGVLPTLLTSGIVSVFTSNQMRQDILTEQSNKVQLLSDSLSRFMAERYGDVQVLSTLPIVSDPTGTASIPTATKTATLERFLKAYGVYSSIVFADLQGNVLLKTSAPAPANFKDVDYFKAVVRTRRPVINSPRRSISTGKYSLFLAAPVFDVRTQAFLGVIRSRIETSTLDELYLKNNVTLQGANYWFVDADNKAFITQNPRDLGQPVSAKLKSLPLLSSRGTDKTQIKVEPIEGVQSAVTYTEVKSISGAGALSDSQDLNWRLVVSQNTQSLFAALDTQLQLVLASLGVTVLLVGAIAVYIANRATKPLLAASNAVQKIGDGDFSVRLISQGDDELAQLGQNINRMAEQIEIAQLAEKEAVLQQAQTQQQVAEQQAALAQKQLAAQEEVARQQATFADEQLRQKETIQMQLLELLSSMDGASQGDLTVRADVSADEIGVVADFFNSIIESLRQIVTQVKLSAQRVNQSVGQDESAIQALAAVAIQQATDINATLNSVQNMAFSIQEVSESAQQTAQVTRESSKAAEMGRDDMDRVVHNITGLQSTIRNTAIKVRQLGEASQEISRALSQISQIALQTDLLAINAEIEAARSGEAGLRFAVVAREVSALAARSAEATQDIEQIIQDIQRATQEVVEAMEVSTTEVEIGSELAIKTKARLEKILSVSGQIDQLVQSISMATESQSQTSLDVTKLMRQVAKTSAQTAESSQAVSEGLERTANITTELQYSVRSFKV